MEGRDGGGLVWHNTPKSLKNGIFKDFFTAFSTMKNIIFFNKWIFHVIQYVFSNTINKFAKNTE